MRERTKKRPDEQVPTARHVEPGSPAAKPLGLVRLTGPWTDQDDRWLEHMTKEPQGKRRVARDPDL